MPLFRKDSDRNRLYRKNGSEYEYIGDLYVFNGTGSAWKNCKLRLWACVFIAAVAQIIAGSIPATGMVNTLYVLIPYVTGLSVTMYLVYKMIDLAFSGSEMREDIYHKTFESFDVAIIVIQIAACICAAGELVRYFTNGGSADSFTVIALELIAAAILQFFVMTEKTMEFDHRPGSAEKQS